MVNQLGNKALLIGIFFFWAISLSGEVDLRALSMDGEPLEQAGVGQPFMIEVGIHNTKGNTSQPHIITPDGVSMHSAGYSMRTINGVSDAAYKYRVVSNKPGNYTFGPAVVTVGIGQQESNTLTITIGQEEKNTHARKKVVKKDDEQSAAVLKLSLDTDDAVVGECIHATLRFYPHHGHVILHEICEPDSAECQGFVVKKKQGPFERIEKRSNNERRYLEWTFDIYPTAPGTLVVPAYHADYGVQTQPRDFFSALFANFEQKKRVYSNACTIPVDALPRFNGTVHAIGSFKEFKATLAPTAAKVGDALALIFELIADDEVSEVALPAIQGIPTSCKWYDSKNYIKTDSRTNVNSKCFESIVQGLEPGDFEIPAQSFTYFDTDERVYKTLKTKPQAFSIIGSGVTKVASLPSQLDTVNNEVVKDQSSQEVDPVGRLAPYELHFSESSAGIHWWLWFLFLIIPIIVIGIAFIYRRLYGAKLWQKTAYAHAKKEIGRAQKNNNAAELYHIFLHFFTMQLRKDAVVTEYDLPELLAPYFENAAKQEAWEQFWQQVSQTAFAQLKSSSLLFEQARNWINYWERVL